MAGTPQLPEGYRRQDFRALGSTNAEAMAAARAGAAGGLWITAREQTAGRGRRGRSWISGPGNLHASLLLIDPAPAEIAPTISFAAGLALDHALADLVGPTAVERFVLKWPNDLLSAGRKCAGILVEGEDLKQRQSSLAVVIGIGVNLVSAPDLEGPHPPTDLRSLGVELDAEALFQRLAWRMAEEIGRWARGRGFAAIRRDWLDRSLGLGGPIRVNLPDRVIEGRFDQLDAAGRLVVTRADGRRETISAGDVFFGTRE